MKGQLRHKIVFLSFQFLLAPFLKWKFHYRYEKVTLPEEPAFILPNHVTNWDPLLVGLSFPKMMYYVASDHLFRLGWLSSILHFLVAPIPRMKSTTDRQTVSTMLKRIREGHNICIFPEGNMTFGGETGELHGTTARLIKHTGAALITYRMEGGYFTQPRWSRSPRKGSMIGYPVHIYSSQELKAMSVEELRKQIEEDLYTNAYEEQEKTQAPVAFHGKNLAENLETTLYLCPSCEKMDQLSSKNDILSCGCGLKLRYTQYGYLESLNQSEPPYTTVLDWYQWQARRIREIALEWKQFPENEAIASDENQTLWTIKKAKRSRLLSDGTLLLFNNRLEFHADTGTIYKYPLTEISDIAIHGQRTLIFTTTDKQYYELKSKTPRSALKYYAIYKALIDQHSIYY